MNLVTLVHDKVSAVALINGVAIGKQSDKSTWRIDFLPQATPSQRTAAQAVLANFNVTAEQAQLDASEATKKAKLIALRAAPGGRAVTVQDLRDTGLI